MRRGPLRVRVGRAALGLALAALGCGAKPPAQLRESAAEAAAPACPAPPPPRPAARGQASLVVQDGHTKLVTQVALGATGKRLASGGFDGTVRAWDTTTGLLLRRLPAAGMVLGVSLSESGDVLAYRAHDGSSVTVSVVDLAAGTAPRSLVEDGAFQVMPDGATVAVGLNGVRLYDARSGTKLREVGIGPVRSLAAFAAGSLLAVALDGEIAIVDVASFRVARRFPQPGYAGPADAVWKIVPADGVLALRTAAGVVHVVSERDGALVRTLAGAFADAAALAGRLVLAEASGRLSALDLSAGTVAPFGDGRPARLVAASRDGSTLALVASGAFEEHVIRIDDVATMRTVRTISGRTAGVTALALRPDGAKLATGSSLAALARWDMTTGELERTSRGEEQNPMVGVSFDASGKLLASAAGTWWVRVRDAASGRLVRQFRPHGEAQVAFARFVRGSELLTAGADGTVRLWDLAPEPAPGPKRFHRFDEVARPEGRVLGTVGWPIHKAEPSGDGGSLALLGAGKVVLSASGLPVSEAMLASMSLSDGTLRWETTVRAASAERWVAYCPDGTALLESSEQYPDRPGKARPTASLAVREAATGAVVRTVDATTFGPIATRGAVVALGGKAPALLSWPALSRTATVAVPDYQVTAIAPHPTRGLFVLGGDGGGSTVIEADTGRIVAVLAATADGEYVTSTPEGLFRASTDGARSVAWTFAPPLEGFSFDQFAERLERPRVVEARLAGRDGEAVAAVGRPPSVRLERATVDRSGGSVTLRATVSSEQRVDRVRAFYDGRLVAERAVCAPQANVALEVPLRGGKGRINVVAYDAEGFASNPAAVDVASTSAQAARPDLWVVSVGVSEYPKLSAEQQLDYADDDARAVTRALSSMVGPSRPFASLQATTLLDATATATAIERALASLERMAEGDLAVVFLAGHGVVLDDGAMVYLTRDAAPTRPSARAEGIGWDRIEALLARARGRVLMLLDACHSGHVSTELVSRNEALAARLAAEGRTGTLVFAAARGSQLSYEVAPRTGAGDRSRGLSLAWEGEAPRVSRELPGGHGLFTSALLEALAGEAPDRDASGSTEIGELVDYVTERVRAASNGKQTPWVARRELFGDFVVVPARSGAAAGSGTPD